MIVRGPILQRGVGRWPGVHLPVVRLSFVDWAVQVEKYALCCEHTKSHGALGPFASSFGFWNLFICAAALATWLASLGVLRWREGLGDHGGRVGIRGFLCEFIAMRGLVHKVGCGIDHYGRTQSTSAKYFERSG